MLFPALPFKMRLAPLRLLGLTVALLAPTQAWNLCRCRIGEPCWPSQAEWRALNASVNGNLIAVRPVGEVCHGSAYDAAKCEEVRSRTNDAAWRVAQPGIHPTHPPVICVMKLRTLTDHSRRPVLDKLGSPRRTRRGLLHRPSQEPHLQAGPHPALRSHGAHTARHPRSPAFRQAPQHPRRRPQYWP